MWSATMEVVIVNISLVLLVPTNPVSSLLVWDLRTQPLRPERNDFLMQKETSCYSVPCVLRRCLLQCFCELENCGEMQCFFFSLGFRNRMLCGYVGVKQFLPGSQPVQPRYSVVFFNKIPDDFWQLAPKYSIWFSGERKENKQLGELSPYVHRIWVIRSTKCCPCTVSRIDDRKVLCFLFYLACDWIM